MEDVINYHNRHLYNKGKNRAASLSDSIILPWNTENDFGGGIVSENGVFIESSSWHEGFKSGYPYNQSNIPYRDEDVLYLGCLYNVWGHAITDNLKKVWYITKHHPLNKIVYITVNNKPLPNYVYELFARVGVDLSKAEHITQITQFKSVINPDNSLVNINENRYYTREFVETINLLLRNIPTINIDKVYFTRTHLNQFNRDIGEKSVERLFEKNGFLIYAPEEHSIEEQLSVLSSCKTFASTEGSISHSTIFCKESTNVVILKKVDYINPYTCFINELRKLNVVYLKAHHSSLASKERPWIGPFFLYITRDIATYCGRHGFHIPFFLLPSWYEYRYKLWSRMKDRYYNYRARLGIKTRLMRIIRITK